MNAPLQRHALQPQRLSIQGDGVRLQAYLWDKAGVPTLLLVHGYPDNHEIWQPLIRELAADYRIVAYDVRGCGASAAPQHLRDYRLERLARDLEAVLLATSAGRPVHLVAHDWGSIQSWEAVTEPRIQPLLASYTSISGPCLDHVGHWLRERLSLRRPDALLQALGQLLSSWYIAFFHLPLLPELGWRLGLDRAWPKLLRRLEGVRNLPPNPTQRSDGMRGVQLYRANFMRSLCKPRSRSTRLPVQLIVPLNDRFVRPQLFADLQRWAPLLTRREVRAGHWQLLAEPGALAGWLRDYVNGLERRESTDRAGKRD
ncbi:alpha/beta fold hydrolase [Ectopseudomonas guguanensis]|uniref:alpha/beta fold hydrolase n=1 Tax=Ectopseudomonas guguanensis TaxID=1198456 RepID=UPI0012D6BDD9|nr:MULTISPECIES: alpha/beta fold hydrolase [Pseudomonas]MPT17133.1 alpha/beta fold hydrolase [Pseudomonas sp.]WJH58300.1 alpha/beta fold hydrolase [Pseudomonas guguanensis]